MFGLKKENKMLQKWIDDYEAENISLKKEVEELKRYKEAVNKHNKDLMDSSIIRPVPPPQPTITLKDNNFPKAVLANLVATHGVDSNDCKNHQRDRDIVMSGIMSTISVGNKEFHLGNKLNKYVIAELIEAGYEIEYDDYGTIIRWGNAYLTPQS